MDFGFAKDKQFTYEMLFPAFRQVRVKENKWKGIGWAVWPASWFLCKYMEQLGDEGQLDLSNKRVLELGSGTGLAALVAANLGANVTATDMAEVMPVLRSNIETSMFAAVSTPEGEKALDSPNIARRDPREVKVRMSKLDVGCEILEWGQDIRKTHPRGAFDVIIGSDLLWHTEYHDQLALTFAQLFDKNTTAYIAHVWRKQEDEQHFFRLIGPWFDVEQVADEREIREYGRRQRLDKYGMDNEDPYIALNGHSEGEDGEPLMVYKITLKPQAYDSIDRVCEDLMARAYTKTGVFRGLRRASTAETTVSAGQLEELNRSGGTVFEASAAFDKANWLSGGGSLGNSYHSQ